MPYDANDVESLPKNVKDLDEHHRHMWVDIWNSTHEHTGSEEKSFRVANGVLKKRLGHSTSTEEKNIDVQEIISKGIGLNVELKEAEIVEDEMDIDSWLT